MKDKLRSLPAPESVEVWQGAADRNRLRLRYLRRGDADTWVKQRLWP